MLDLEVNSTPAIHLLLISSDRGLSFILLSDGVEPADLRG